MKPKANLLWGFAITLAIFALLFTFYGDKKTWELWGLRPTSPYFADVRVIIAGGQSYAHGYDPLKYNPEDPWQRRMNYPRIWQSFYLLGLNQSHTTIVAAVFIVLFLIGVYLLVPSMDNPTVWFLIAAICSPATLSGIGLANIDLVMFFLLALSVALVRRHYVLSAISITFAFVLKLFPIFGVVVLLRQKPKVFVTLTLSLLAFALFYAWLTFDDLLLVYDATPKSTLGSFGVNVFWMRVVPWMKAVWGYEVETAPKLLSYFAAVSILLYAGLQLWSDKRSTDQADVGLDAFRTGSAVYIGAFMLGNNGDYRLMFLLFTIPQLLFWARHTKGHVRGLSIMTLGAIYLSLWDVYFLTLVYGNCPYWQHNAGCAAPGGTVVFLLAQLCNWATFCGLSYLFVLSMPDWVAQYARQLWFGGAPVHASQSQASTPGL